MQKIQLMRNEVQIPFLGFGTFIILDREAVNVVHSAIEVGYSHIDTAAYRNEKRIGEDILRSYVSREDLLLVSKVWNDRQELKETLNVFQGTLNKLQTDYLDMYLIHWPIPQSGECWAALEELYRIKKVRAIGGCNFTEGQIFQIPVLKTIANKYNCTVTQLALAWELRQDNISLVKATVIQLFQENFYISEVLFSSDDRNFMDKPVGNRLGSDPKNFDF